MADSGQKNRKNIKRKLIWKHTNILTETLLSSGSLKMYPFCHMCKTLPKVYDPKERPWIKAENASPEELKIRSTYAHQVH